MHAAFLLLAILLLAWAIRNVHAQDKPVVEIVAGSLQYYHQSNHLVFKWKVMAGRPDKLDLLYRKQGSSDDDWKVLLAALHPSTSSYDAALPIALPPMPYEFVLRAYEGGEATDIHRDSPDSTYKYTIAGEEVDEDGFTPINLVPVIFGMLVLLISVILVVCTIKHQDNQDKRRDLTANQELESLEFGKDNDKEVILSSVTRSQISRLEDDVEVAARKSLIIQFQEHGLVPPQPSQDNAYCGTPPQPSQDNAYCGTPPQLLQDNASCGTPPQLLQDNASCGTPPQPLQDNG